MVKVAILGAGYMGKVHATALTKSGNAHVVAVCSKPFETAQLLCDTVLAGKAQAFEDFDKMLGSVDFDALYVCLPPFAHAGEIQKAAKARKHLFVEKPLGLDVRKAAEMAALASRGRLVTQMGYHMRYGAAVQKLKSMIDDGTAGKPTLFDGAYMCNALHTPWWRDRAKSGGQIVEQVIHLYDLAMHFLGKPRTVSALAANLSHRKVKAYSVEDTSAAIIGFQGGAMASITASNCAIPTKWRGLFTVVCENVTAEFVDHNNAIFTFHGGKASEEWWPTGKFPEAQDVKGEADAYLEEDKAFVAAVAQRKPLSADLKQGLRSLQLVMAAYKSATAGGKQVVIK